MNVLEEYAQATRKTSPRPTTWADIIGNARAKEILREAIAAAKKDRQPLPHTLLFGPPGMGKSTISKVVANEMSGAFIETTASTLEIPADIIRFLYKMNEDRERTSNPSVLFVDEIHMLGNAKGRQAVDQESIFPLLEDWRFPHNLVNKTVQMLDGQDRTMTSNTFLVWPFTCIGATTEAGMLSTPLLRRFLLKIELEPYSEVELAQILMGASQRLGTPMTEEAAADLAKFSRRNPGMANELLTHARQRASAEGSSTITATIADAVVSRLGLYPKGLSETDVRVLRALYDRSPKGMGMAECSRAVGISLSQFTGMVEPYLRLLNFMETQTRRVIRPEGIRYLAEIGKIDPSRPDVRAALA